MFNDLLIFFSFIHLSLKIKIKKLEALLNTWSKLDELNDRIRRQLHSDELNTIISDEFANKQELIEDALIESSSSCTSKENLPQQQQQQRVQKLLSLNLTDIDLNEIGLEIEKSQVYLDSLRAQLSDLISSSGELVVEKQVPVYNRLSLTMDKFKFELNYLRTNLNEISKSSHVHQNQHHQNNHSNLLHHSDENRLHIDLSGNQITYKSSSHRQPNQRHHDYSDMLTDIHLDFQVNILFIS